MKFNPIVVESTRTDPFKEFCNWKYVDWQFTWIFLGSFCRGLNTTNGWSAVGGQTNSAYVIGGIQPGDTPMGHSVPSLS